MASEKELLSLKTTQEFLKTIGGSEAPELVRICLSKKKDVTDEQIGKKLPLKVTEIRTILNRLHYRGIASYQKTRDSKSGWYSYTWKIETRRLAEALLEQQTEEIEKLEQKASFEQNYALFGCDKGCSTMPFEIATEYQFKCPECTKSMNAINTARRQKAIRQQIEQKKRESNILKKHKK